MSMNWRGFTKDPWDKGNYAEVQGPSGSARVRLSAIALVLLGLSLANLTPASAQDAEPTGVITEAELREAWADPMRTSIELGGDIFLRQCKTGDPIRESARPMTLDGNGHTIRQTCFEKRVLRQDGTGYLLIKDVTLTRGRLRRSRRGGHDQGRDRGGRLQGPAEPGRGARRRDLLDAPGDRSGTP